MPKGPQGQKRPADAIGAAVMVARISVGEVEDAKGKAPARAKGGKVGGRARAVKLTPAKRKKIAKKAADARWSVRKSKSALPSALGLRLRWQHVNG